MEEQITLCDGKTGVSYQVKSMNLAKATQMRLFALGMTEGTSITVLNNKKSGSVIFNVRGTRLAVGRKIASEIYLVS